MATTPKRKKTRKVITAKSSTNGTATATATRGSQGKSYPGMLTHVERLIRDAGPEGIKKTPLVLALREFYPGLPEDGKSPIVYYHIKNLMNAGKVGYADGNRLGGYVWTEFVNSASTPLRGRPSNASRILAPEANEDSMVKRIVLMQIDRLSNDLNELRKIVNKELS